MKVYISLGSNEGVRINHLRKAVSLLKEKKILKYIHHSIIVETKALLPLGAPKPWNKNYYNMVVSGETKENPHILLKKLKEIELEMGRKVDHLKWSPRNIDLDILLFGKITIKTKELILPHPELKNRIFFQHLLVLMGEKQYALKMNQQELQKSIIKSLVLEPLLVGVVNITKDSFSDGGLYFKPQHAFSQCVKLMEDGASVIEIGAQSTRPHAKIQSPTQEFKTLKPVLEKLNHFNGDNVSISVDTFFPEVIKEMIKHFKVDYINDVSGKLDNEILKSIAKKNIKICIMHSLTVPAHPKIFLNTKSVIKELIGWGKKTVARLIKVGFDFENIVLDPGIGFGKTPHQNLEILKNVDAFSCFRNEGIKLMVGHSRKSYINIFNTRSPNMRDLETMAISSALRKQVDFLRVHNVEDHMRLLSVLDV